MKVCLVEDNDALRDILCSALQNEGIDVEAVSDGEELNQLLQWKSFDSFILDLNLPGEDGLSIASRLRQANPSCFIIMTTVREKISDRVQGYESGADIYMPKPVHIRELVAALNTCSRRPKSAQVSQKPKPTWTLKGLKLTAVDTNVTAGLTGAEYALLRALVIAGGKPLEHWELFEILGKEPSVEAKGVLQVHMVNLRKKLSMAGLPESSLQSIRGKGYCLNAPIHLI